MLWDSSVQAKPQPFLVVLDPGHGGTDRGATLRADGRDVQEKDLTLLLSLATAQELRKRGIRAVLTRREDQDLALADRTSLANRLGADAFLSLHLNSDGNGSTGAKGFETYVLNHSNDDSSKRLADLENSVLQGSVAKTDRPEGQDDVSLIVKDLILDGNSPRSRQLACQIQAQVVNESGIPNRGVKQALFYVLLGADMPSALIEAGFINNAADRARLSSVAGRRRIAIRIAEAVRAFRDQKTPSHLASCRIH